MASADTSSTEQQESVQEPGSRPGDRIGIQRLAGVLSRGTWLALGSLGFVATTAAFLLPGSSAFEIGCTLNAVGGPPDGRQIWVVGNKGFAARSVDRGNTWTKVSPLHLAVGAPVRQTPQVATPTPPGPAMSSYRRYVELADLQGAAAAVAIKQAPSVTPVPSPRGGAESRPDGKSVLGSRAADGPRVTPAATPLLSPTPRTAFVDGDVISTDIVSVNVIATTVTMVFDRGENGFLSTDDGLTWTAMGQREPALASTYPSRPERGSFHRDAVLGAWLQTFPGSPFRGGVRSGWAMESDGTLCWSDTFPSRWGRVGRLPFRPQAFASFGPRAALAVGGGGMVADIDLDRAEKVRSRSITDPGLRVDLTDVALFEDGRTVIVTGTAGAVFRSEDRGATWRPMTRGAGRTDVPLRWPLAGYALALALVGLGYLRPRQTEEAPPSIADILSSDKPLQPGDVDVTDLSAKVRALSRFLRNDKTTPPLTVAVIGAWGTGKSSLMNLLKADLESFGFRPVWFNAWHHQKEEHLLASLLQSVRLQAIPGYWTWPGLQFRVKLGWSRLGLGRKTIPLMLAAALFALFVGLWAGGSGQGLADTLVKLQGNDWRPVLTPLGAFGSFVLLLKSAMGLLAPFGVRPATLLATMSKGVSVRDLEERTSFRQEFAREFSEVTRALGVRSMPIFIDDLDRCRPEQVLEVLESVNFLVTSGDCFVVLGMARERVEGCIGLSFKDVAAELAPADGSGETEKDKREQRARYARSYLDKLINVEVLVQPFTSTEARKLLSVASEAARVAEVPPGRDARVAVGVAAGVAAALLVGLAYKGGERLAPRVSELLGHGSGAGRSAAPVTQAKSGAVPDVAADQIPPDEKALFAEVPPPGQDGEAPRLTPLGRGGRIAPTAVATIFFLALLVRRPRPGVVVKDSANFSTALAIWSKVVFERHRTPRAIKRFVNKVRFLAVLMGPQSQSAERLSEATLVAVAALAEVDKLEWLEGAAAQLPIDPENKLLSETLAAHRRHFGDTGSLAAAVDVYRVMASTVTTR